MKILKTLRTVIKVILRMAQLYVMIGAAITQLMIVCGAFDDETKEDEGILHQIAMIFATILTSPYAIVKMAIDKIKSKAKGKSKEN